MPIVETEEVIIMMSSKMGTIAVTFLFKFLNFTQTLSTSGFHWPVRDVTLEITLGGTITSQSILTLL